MPQLPALSSLTAIATMIAGDRDHPCHSKTILCRLSSGHLPDQRKILMDRIFFRSRSLPSVRAAFVLLICATPTLALAQNPPATLTQISSDPFTVGPGQHATE